MNQLTIDQKQFVASFDVDSQNTFTPLCPDELPVPAGLEIVAELNAQASKAAYRLGSKDAHSAKAIWVADEKHPTLSTIQGENVDVYWPRHAEPGTLGFQLIDGLPKITDYDYFVWKGVEVDMHPYGACYHDFAEKLSTGAIEFLRSKQISTVIVGGLATDYCVKNTALQLLRAGFKVVLNLGACRAISPVTETQTLEELKKAGVQMVNSAVDILNRL